MNYQNHMYNVVTMMQTKTNLMAVAAASFWAFLPVEEFAK